MRSQEEGGPGMAATLFVKAGAEYIRVATGVLNPDGSGRAVGAVLGGAALDSIKAGKPYYGEVQVLGTPYIAADYQPIKDASGSASSSSATKGDAATKGGSCPSRRSTCSRWRSRSLSRRRYGRCPTRQRSTSCSNACGRLVRP